MIILITSSDDNNNRNQRRPQRDSNSGNTSPKINPGDFRRRWGAILIIHKERDNQLLTFSESGEQQGKPSLENLGDSFKKIIKRRNLFEHGKKRYRRYIGFVT